MAYQEQLVKGDIQEAYSGLVKYVQKLSSQLASSLSDKYSFGSLFQGYMDYTYFYYSNDFLKQRKLRFGLVLNHSNMRFELWLLGQNLDIQEKYWGFFKSTHWNKDRTVRPQYSVIETTLIENPDFNDLEQLSESIEKALLKTSEKIIEDILRSNLI